MDLITASCLYLYRTARDLDVLVWKLLEGVIAGVDWDVLFYFFDQMVN